VYGQLSLFAALLFGIVAMHTLGHPSGHGTTTGSEHATVSAYAMSSPHEPSAHEHGQASTAVPARTAPVLNAGPPPMGGDGMDPSAVCLAVLGAFTFLVLMTVALGRPRSAAAALSGPRLPHALWPDPPPPRTLLARLSVLRI
jgi:hypothetical protein